MGYAGLDAALLLLLRGGAAAAAVAKDNPSFYASLLRACAHSKALSHGRLLHAARIAMARAGGGWDNERALSNLLVHMYGKCGSVRESRALFARIPRGERELFCWNSLIAAESRHGQREAALCLYREMLSEGLAPNKYSFLPVLSACADLAALEQGKIIHQQIVHSGLDSDIFLRSALVHMYAKCGSLTSARIVFDGSDQRNVVCWNTMISGYTHNGQAEEALKLFSRMPYCRVTPSKATFLSALDACGIVLSLEYGRAIHKSIGVYGLDSDVAITNALVHMYGKCGSFNEAKEVFGKMRVRDVVSWNTLIAAYIRVGCFEEGLCLFRQMELQGLQPDSITFLCILDAGTSLGNVKAAHEEIAARGFDTCIEVRNALITAYGNFGAIEVARGIFDHACERDVVSWTAIITVYAKNGRPVEALELFARMELECNQKPNTITFLSVLDACATLASLRNGRAVHKRITARGLNLNPTMKTALLNMYAKCGSLVDALDVFSEMHEWDGISWNAMIAAFAQNGYSKEALRVFAQMDWERFNPDKITFLSVLHACNCAGLPGFGWYYFVSMSKDFGITASVEHYKCMVDLVGHTSSLEVVEDMMKNMPIQPDAAAWNTLLSAC